jgi:NTE family protein
VASGPNDGSRWAASALFAGLPEDVLAPVLQSLERRRYPAGEVVIAEGDRPGAVTIIEQGTADVFVADRRGAKHRVSSLGPGSTLGEMSLFTGEPASGTVRATTDLDVIVMREGEFESLAAAHPLIYRNLGAILAERLARTNRLAARDRPGRLVLLVDRGGPPEIALALAASVAWHSRTPTLLVAVGEAREELAQLSAAETSSSEPRAHLLAVPSLEALREQSQIGRVEDFFAGYAHVLVLTADPGAVEADAERVIALVPHQTGTAVPSGATLRGWVRGTPSSRDGVVDVPPLTDADIQHLHNGALPLTTPVGRAVGGVARDVLGTKVGLALGAGSLKGYAHFGALEALERLGVPIDVVAGTSVGALAAATHALGMTPQEASDVFDRSGPSIFRPTISTRGLLTNRHLARFFRGEIGDARIEDQRVPLGVVAADLETHREVVFRRGLLWLALLGSMSIPGIYPALRVGRYTVADGGILNPVPSSVAASMGADIVVAIRLSAGLAPPEAEAEAILGAGRPPSSLGALLRSFDIMYSRLTTDFSGATLVSVTPHLPEVPGASLRNFTRGREYIRSGEEAVADALPRLRTVLPWLVD